MSVQGVIEGEKIEWIVLNNFGQEVPGPSYSWYERQYDAVYGRLHKKGKGKGKGKIWSCDADRRDRDPDWKRDRSRSRGRDRSRSRRRDRTPDPEGIPPAPPSPEIVSNPPIIELSHTIDCISRCEDRNEQLASFCKQQVEHLENLVEVMKERKTILEAMHD